MCLLLQLGIALMLSYFLAWVVYLFYPKAFGGTSKFRKIFLPIIIFSLPVFMVVNAMSQNSWSPNLDFGRNFENLSSYLILLATIVTAFLLYSTLTIQHKSSQLAEFENRFFKLIDYHRENVNQIRYADPKRHGNEPKNPKDNPVSYIEGNRAFRRITEEFVDLLKSSGFAEVVSSGNVLCLSPL